MQAMRSAGLALIAVIAISTGAFFAIPVWSQGGRSLHNSSGKEFTIATIDGHTKPGTVSLSADAVAHFGPEGTIQAISGPGNQMGDPRYWVRYKAADGDYLYIHLVSPSGVQGGIHLKDIRVTTMKDASTGNLVGSVVSAERFDDVFETGPRPEDRRSYAALEAKDGKLLIRALRAARPWEGTATSGQVAESQDLIVTISANLARNTAHLASRSKP